MKELSQSAISKIEQCGGLININVGSGTDTKVGYINYDIDPNRPEVDINDDINNIDEYFSAGTVDNIILFQVLEHFGRHEWRDILSRLCALLKVGGRIHIRMPYIPDIVDENRRGRISDADMMLIIYGAQENYPAGFPYLDHHKSGVTIAQFKDEFEKNGMLLEEANHVFGIGMIHVVALKK